MFTKQNQEKISWKQLLDILPNHPASINVHGTGGSSAAYAVSRFLLERHASLIVVTDSVKSAEQFIQDIGFFTRQTAWPVLYFPPYNLLPFKYMAYHNETAARRIKTLYHLIESDPPTLTVTTVGALQQKLLPKDAMTQFSELLMVGEEVDRDNLIQKLVAGGYNRAAVVEEPGDFSLRGGILDVFSPLYPDPVRIEFFGDTVDSIRSFSADTQRTSNRLDEAVILPARETIVQRSEINQIAARIRTRASELGLPVTQVRQIIQRIKEEGVFPGIEGLSSLIYEHLDCFWDYVSSRSLFVFIEPGNLAAAASQFEEQVTHSCQSARDHGQLCVEPSEIAMSWDQIQNHLLDWKPLSFRALPVSSQGTAQLSDGLFCETRVSDTDDLRRSLVAARSSETPFQVLSDWLTKQRSSDKDVLMVCRRPSNHKRLRQILSTYGIEPASIESLADTIAVRGRVYILDGAVSAGFSWPEAGLALITDEEIFGTVYRRPTTPARRKVAEILNLDDLKQGDLVVHADHGIGRYEGLAKLRLNGSTNDFLQLLYKDDDKLYVPVERMNLIQKYMGVDGFVPVLDKMGGKSWERMKDKVKRSAEKIAGELLKLYAQRKVQQGYAYAAGDNYFREFEEGFPFEETADQRKAIEQVLDDMRRPMPMDRLICGDVGYGKTEVALRAAFLAINDGKQVAVLVPTTVLAEQHFETFKSRFERYPVQVASMSRFRPLKEQKQIVDGLKQGTIDIVIGTHRLLQKDIAFKDLGLLILDEEQRFGVRHKERIKRMRANVDVLTLTATPIPRTLHLSLLGIRDISIISTPPEQRRPIVTYISEFDDALVAEAVRKELRRGGQIFFVHNIIRGIQRIADRLRQLVPEVRLGVAHGRMPEDQLEKVMLDFMQKRLDMLVCTTIVESGLDVASANTMFINRADHFGLAQIYQLRGRVGRSDEQAYAYLFIPAESTLTKEAQKRLKVLMEYSDLGSGFQIAMSDLKIRGGGTILGASQSGHIAAVGYDMFLKLMETSIAEIKGEPVIEDLEPEINLPLSAFIGEDYISDIDQRLLIYRRLARMTELKEISDLKSEMTDRFGRLPEESENLLLKIMLKIMAVRAGCKKLDLYDNRLALAFSEAHQKNPFGIIGMITDGSDRCQFTPDHVFKASLTPGTEKSLVAQTKNILIEIARHVNQ